MGTRTVTVARDSMLRARKLYRQKSVASYREAIARQIAAMPEALRADAQHIADMAFEAGKLTAYDKPFVVLIGDECPG